jgi:hypothetical protein
MTLDFRKLKIKIKILRKSDGKNRTKSLDDGQLVGSFEGRRDKLKMVVWGGVLYVSGVKRNGDGQGAILVSLAGKARRARSRTIYSNISRLSCGYSAL